MIVEGIMIFAQSKLEITNEAKSAFREDFFLLILRFQSSLPNYLFLVDYFVLSSVWVKREGIN